MLHHLIEVGIICEHARVHVWSPWGSKHPIDLDCRERDLESHCAIHMFVVRKFEA